MATSPTSDRWRSRLRRRVEHPSFARWAACVAFVFALPSLAAGFFLDDHVHRFFLTQSSRFSWLSRSPLDIFSLVHRSAAERKEMLDRGFLPWWTADDLQFALVRPLSSLTHALDYALWPTQPALMHLHSLLWFAAVVLAAGALYRRLLEPPFVAGLATLLFALDDAHGMMVGWIANRNALLTAVFGLIALVAHDAWRRDGDRRGAVLGPAMFACGLLAGESIIGFLGYLCAHAAFIDRAPWSRRLAALAPYAGLTLIWLVSYRVLGYGVVGSGVYLDPLNDPAGFLAAVGKRGPGLLLGQLATPPSETVLILEELTRHGHLIFVGVALAFLLFVAWVLRPLWSRDPSVRFFGAGMLLSVVPVCAAIPDDRLLLNVGIGAMGVVASLVGRGAAELGRLAPSRHWRVSARVLTIGFLIFHAGLGPLLLPLRVLSPRLLEARYQGNYGTLPQDPELGEQTLVIVNAPDAGSCFLLFFWMWGGGWIPPARVRCLSAQMLPFQLTRPDDRTLVARSETGYVTTLSERATRSKDSPFTRGALRRLPGFSVDVSEVSAEGRPTEVVFRFDVPLEDRSLRWVTWKDGRYVPFTPPALGDTLLVEGAMLNL